MLISHTICHQGLVREQNEDSYFSSDKEGIWLVADGVGGNVGGHIASQLSVQTVERNLRQGESLAAAILAANQAVISAASQQQELNGMATTVVAAQIRDNKFQLAWVGDSRAYLIDSEYIHLLSADHNVAFELYSEGQITQQELRDHPGQHELTQALGLTELSNVAEAAGTLSDGAILLLCSDGLSGVLSDELIFEIVQRQPSLESASEVLLGRVIKAGAPDNVTFSLIQYISDDPELAEVGEEKIASQKVDDKTKRNIQNKAPLTWSVLFFVTLVMLFMLFN